MGILEWIKEWDRKNIERLRKRQREQERLRQIRLEEANKERGRMIGREMAQEDIQHIRRRREWNETHNAFGHGLLSDVMGFKLKEKMINNYPFTIIGLFLGFAISYTICSPLQEFIDSNWFNVTNSEQTIENVIIGFPIALTLEFIITFIITAITTIIGFIIDKVRG